MACNIVTAYLVLILPWTILIPLRELAQQVQAIARPFVFMLLVGSIAGILFAKTTMSANAWAGVSCFVEIAGVFTLQIYALQQPPLLQGHSVWYLIVNWAWYLIVVMVPGILLANAIARDRHTGFILQRFQDSIRMINAYPERCSLFMFHPIFDELNDLYESTFPTTDLETTLEIRLQNFSDWWFRFVLWAHDLMHSFNPMVLPQLLHQAGDSHPQPLFGHSTAFPWPEPLFSAISQVNLAWQMLKAICIDKSAAFKVALLDKIAWPQSKVKNTLSTIMDYVLSWHFVEYLGWSTFSILVTAYLLQKASVSD